MTDRECMIDIFREMNVLRNIHGSSVANDRESIADRLIEAGFGYKGGMIQVNNRIVCRYCGSHENIHVCSGKPS